MSRLESREHQLLLEATAELARLRAESAELKQKVSDLEAETMTLTSERDTARMGQEELLAKLRSEGQDWRLAAAAFEANAAEIAELKAQLAAAQRVAAEVDTLGVATPGNVDLNALERRVRAGSMAGEDMYRIVRVIGQLREIRATSATGVRLVGPCPTIEAAPRLAVAKLSTSKQEVLRYIDNASFSGFGGGEQRARVRSYIESSAAERAVIAAAIVCCEPADQTLDMDSLGALERAVDALLALRAAGGKADG